MSVSSVGGMPCHRSREVEKGRLTISGPIVVFGSFARLIAGRSIDSRRGSIEFHPPHTGVNGKFVLRGGKKDFSRCLRRKFKGKGNRCGSHHFREVEFSWNYRR